MCFDYDQISPGVRDLVRELREVHGMETTDSGDGSNLAAGMECALPERHVFMQTHGAEDMVYCARVLARAYPDARVECSWSPGEPAIIMLWPDGAPGGVDS